MKGEIVMAIYLETNALRKITDYSCDKHVYTSIFSIFELLSGMNEKEYEIRKTCLSRIKKQKLEIKGPMIDKLFMSLLGSNEYNNDAYKKIMEIFTNTLKTKSFEEFSKLEIYSYYKNENINVLKWLKNWDNKISDITKKSNYMFEPENKEYIKSIYLEKGLQGLADHYWKTFEDSKIDEQKLAHAEAFIGSNMVYEFRNNIDLLFSKYNYKLFMSSQAAIFSYAYYINGKTQNPNNASDLLHLLYLDENDFMISNDKIYHSIKEACPVFNYIYLQNEKSLSELAI